MRWSGEAVVFGSIVNWIKGSQKGKKRLYIQQGNDPARGWRYQELDAIGPALFFDTDVTRARTIRANAATGCYQGQTHGHDGFLVSIKEAQTAIAADQRNLDVLFPYLIGDSFVGRKDAQPTRYLIDFASSGSAGSASLPVALCSCSDMVLPDGEEAADEEKSATRRLLLQMPKRE